MPISASKLREDIYNLLDQVLATGAPVEVVRRGKLLRIVPAEKPSRLDRLKKRAYPLADPESIVELDWLPEWSELR